MFRFTDVRLFFLFLARGRKNVERVSNCRKSVETMRQKTGELQTVSAV